MQRPNSPLASQEEGSKKDKVYRRYASNVERALSLFDTALQEWADYIAFLGRLLKALQSKPANASDIPHRRIVAKRLAQCLAPVLPSGVHQKTLEVYAYVFAVIGKHGLSKDLGLWLPGISPTLSSASLSVKPLLLSLYEDYIVPLDAKVLRPALKSILLALLPGLDEESSEEYDRTLRLINQFRRAIFQGDDELPASQEYTGDQYLWQDLFLVAITSSSRRQGVLAYLNKEFPLLGQAPSNKEFRTGAMIVLSSKVEADIEAVTSPEPGLLIRCFTAGLQDEQLLIQRGFLDLLVSHMPLHSAVFHQRVFPEDLELLVIAAASVVARREMSLNRRLWTWLLGPHSSKMAAESDAMSPRLPDLNRDLSSGINQILSGSQYFERYGLEPLIDGILKMTANDSLSSVERARPFRICLSLMDRWEVGGVVIPRVFLPAMESIWRYHKEVVPKDALAEVLRSATVLFDGIESSLIWAKLNEVLVDSLGARSGSRKGQLELSATEGLDLVSFMLTKFNVQEEEMVEIYIPLSCLALLIRLRLLIETSVQQDLPLTEAFSIALTLVDLLSSRPLSPNASAQTVSPDGTRQSLLIIQQFFETVQSKSEEVISPLECHIVSEALVSNACLIVATMIESLPVRTGYFERSISIFDRLLRKSSGLGTTGYDGLISTLGTAMDGLDSNGNAVSLPILGTIVSLLETVKSSSPITAWESDQRVSPILSALLTILWKFTSPSRPKYNVEAVRCLWRIHWISPDAQLVEGSISTLIFHDVDGKKGQDVDMEGARRFTTLWAHSTSGFPSPADRQVYTGGASHTVGRPTASSPSDPDTLSRPLLLMLDMLRVPQIQVSMFISRWLHSLPSLQRYETLSN